MGPEFPITVADSQRYLNGFHIYKNNETCVHTTRRDRIVLIRTLTFILFSITIKNVNY